MCGIARDERLDSVKFWTMMLVIVGHAFMMTTCSSNPINRIVFEWIYLFHMPLFVFLSGFFTHTHTHTHKRRPIRPMEAVGASVVVSDSLPMSHLF